MMVICCTCAAKSESGNTQALEEVYMMRRFIQYSSNAKFIAKLHHLPGLALGLLALAGMLYIGTDVKCVYAAQNPSRSVSGAQVHIHSIAKDEYKAYNAALLESDPQKRAARLYEFIQKYSKSILIERISNEDYDRIKIIEGGYNAFHSAMQEPDLIKRSTMLIETHQKYPQSDLVEYIYDEYIDMLNGISQDKEYELLESLGEKWLAVRPNDAKACAFVAEAAVHLHKYQRCGECLETIYEAKPSPGLAREIRICYQKTDNSAKQTEWAERLLKMPEFDDDYMLRFDFMRRFLYDKNLPKAAEYAQLALKSADLVRQPDGNTKERLRKVRRACHHVIASNLLAEGNFTDAISEFTKAIEAEKYGEGYYGIGQCLDREKEIEKALHYYAAAELMGGEEAPNARDRLEVLYRILHNDTLIGIDKVYNRAKQLLQELQS